LAQYPQIGLNLWAVYAILKISCVYLQLALFARYRHHSVTFRTFNRLFEKMVINVHFFDSSEYCTPVVGVFSTSELETTSAVVIFVTFKGFIDAAAYNNLL
jgi:hypothetical protein